MIFIVPWGWFHIEHKHTFCDKNNKATFSGGNVFSLCFSLNNSHITIIDINLLCFTLGNLGDQVGKSLVLCAFA